ncbi:hypothetical protein Bbelb_182700 [Branchiostoma belcheri]|nr:hypothetical protein Bbelb_182700 [Branchiostoma belcheri]
MSRRSWLVFKTAVVITAVFLVVIENELIHRPRPPSNRSGGRVQAEAASGARGHPSGVRRVQADSSVREHPDNNSVALMVTAKRTKLCVLNTDVVFIYTPACGSDVLQNSLFRFGYRNHLFVTLPRKPGSPSIGQGHGSGDIRGEDLLQPPAMVSRQSAVNILAHQVRYNRDALSKIVTGNAKYITILRNPLDRFETDFVSSQLEKQFDVAPRAGQDQSALKRYLGAPEFWEKRKMHANPRCTSNCMSQALGIPVRTGMKMSPWSGDKTLIDYIDNLESEFALVLIYEELNPSLVLLKRYMCWSFKDILYDAGLMEPAATQRGKIEEEQKIRFRRVNGADYLLYYHFYDVFSAKVAAEGEDFQREVKQFKHVLDKVSRYCSSAIRDWKVANQTVVWGSQWDDEFVVTREMCGELRMKTGDWDKLFRARYSSY